MAEHLLAQVRHDALAERRHEIEAAGAGHREHEDDADHHPEIIIDQPFLADEAEIDHPAHGDRHGERCQGGHHEGHEGRSRPDAIPEHIGNQ